MLVYFRFAQHKPVLPAGVSAHVYTLHPEEGFENFIAEIFTVIEKFGKGVFYVFDCLSELAVDWYSDRMLGNFFMLTCPYLYDFDTVRKRALSRDFTGLQLWVRGVINMINSGLPKAKPCIHIAEAILKFLEPSDMPGNVRAEKIARLAATLIVCLLDSYPEYRDVLGKTYLVGK